jgi:hypothetical protein
MYKSDIPSVAAQWSLALMLAYAVVCVCIFYLCRFAIAATTAVPFWLAPRTYLGMRSGLRLSSSYASSDVAQPARFHLLTFGLGILLVACGIDLLTRVMNFLTGDTLMFMSPYPPSRPDLFIAPASIAYLFVNVLATPVNRLVGTATTAEAGSGAVDEAESNLPAADNFDAGEVASS